MIYELRLYSVVPGRLDVSLERFANHLPAVFARHSIRNVGRWTASAGPGGPMFVYMMAYHDLAEREAQWTAFYGDPAWARIRAETQGDEEAVERFDLYFLKASACWTPPAERRKARLGGAHDLIFAEVALGRNAAANAYLAETYLPLLQRCGGEIMLVADFISGPAMPRVAIMVAWQDAAARAAAWREINGDTALAKTLAAQRRTLGRAALGRSDVYLLEPTPFALPLATLGNPLAAASLA